MVFLASRLLVALVAAVVSVSALPANLTIRAGGKAGISWPIQEQAAAPVQAFFGAGSDLTWWFNWNKNYGTKLFPADSVKPSIDATFVPMFFDSSFFRNGAVLEPGWQAVMGYNEPDLHGTAGVSTPASPAEAGAKWKAIVDELRRQNPAVEMWSPAVAWNKQWLKDFFANICPGGIPGCTYAPKYLNIHIYATTLAEFKNQVNAYHDAFGLDVIISEYACHQFIDGQPSPAVSIEQASQFMRDTTAWMDSTAWVHKYAWFGAVRNAEFLYAVNPSNRLMDANGQLTALGKQYVAGGR